MQVPIQIIVGLGNPGEKYAQTRHNAGAWFVERLAHVCNISLKTEPKFHGKVGRITLPGHSVFLLLPTTFMNLSGQAVRAISQFYHVIPESILIAHDELDFPAGTVKLKQGGGHGGHNGLKDIIQHLQTPNFYRLRLGIGHPGDRNKVLDYVLDRPSKHDTHLIIEAINRVITTFPEPMMTNMEKAMHALHTKDDKL